MDNYNPVRNEVSDVEVEDKAHSMPITHQVLVRDNCQLEKKDERSNLLDSTIPSIIEANGVKDQVSKSGTINILMTFLGQKGLSLAKEGAETLSNNQSKLMKSRCQVSAKQQNLKKRMWRITTTLTIIIKY